MLLVLIAIAAGAFLPLQVGMNTRLAHFVGGPVRASLVSFTVGGLILLTLVAVAYRGGGHRAANAPWWAWIGGALGAFYVVSAIVVGPRLGATTFFGILVATQLLVSVVLDRFGWLGYAQHAPSPGRLAGVAMLVCPLAGNYAVRVIEWPLARAHPLHFSDTKTVIVSFGTNQLASFRVGTNDSFSGLVGTNSFVHLEIVPMMVGTNQLLGLAVPPGPQAEPGLGIQIINLSPAGSFIVATKV